jgi:hypothetical protein
MESNDRLLFEISELITKAFERSISDEEFNRLQYLIRTDTKALDYYFDIVTTFSCLGDIKKSDFDVEEDIIEKTEYSKSEAEGVFDSNVPLMGVDLQRILSDESAKTTSAEDTSHDIKVMQTLQELAVHEKAAPHVEIHEEKPNRELIHEIVYPPRQKRKIHPFFKFVLISNAAALLFIVLFVKFFPKPLPSAEVATVVDQIHVQWGQPETSLENGSRLWTNEYPLDLKKGIVSIQYDEGTQVVIEGPALFEIEREGIFLNYGRLYSRVFETGSGFIVETPTSRFVDMGTEFGVQADIDGSTELHVTKGKVQLFAGSEGQIKNSQMVTEDNAARFDANSGRLQSIPIQQQVFVRRIDSKTDFIWDGKMTLNLADVIGGGNGFGTGKRNSWLDVQTGQFTNFANQNETEATKTYVNVVASDYIDGVFTPDGGSWQVQVSSEGHIFSECPDTGGAYSHNISNGHEISLIGAAGSGFGPRFPPVLAGKRYGTKEDPVIILTTNKGITFDLAALRKVVPETDIRKFTAICGLSERDIINNICQRYGGAANFWVLVDGQVRFNTEITYLAGYSPDPPATISVPLNRNDRFLTLIATDGYTYDNGFMNDIWEDYSLFAKPTLHLVEKHDGKSDKNK